MYVPSPFAVHDSEQLHAFIRSHGFAILVSLSDNVESPPLATHLPLLLQETQNANVRLAGHVARGNSQWKLADGQKVLAIFSGPHAHISASWYGENNVVPTWNYVAVHVTGTLQIEEDPDRLLKLLNDTVSQYESAEPHSWNFQMTDANFRTRMLQGIVGFVIDIDTIQGCWKLSQHHSESRRSGAIAGLRQRAKNNDVTIADLMESAARPDSEQRLHGQSQDRDHSIR